jgi:uncharacterized low-complexity protein
MIMKSFAMKSVTALGFLGGALALTLPSASLAESRGSSGAQAAPGNANQFPYTANAQNTARAEGDAGQADCGRQAPIGHRQPRARDLPPEIEGSLGVRSSEDAVIDSKLHSICRGC